MEKYLERLNVSLSEMAADHRSLCRLQRAHLMHVPFENLDIHWKRPIKIDVDAFYRKIVDARRGGFCYELNGLFNELLRYVGFRTRLVSARVYDGEKAHGPEFDHAAIIVSIGKEEYLADVGFGDFTVEPLRFILDEEQTDRSGVFVIRQFDDEYLEVAKQRDIGWESEYIFMDKERDLADFSDMCDHQQDSPESHFTKGKMCSILTESGRKTLTDTKYIVTENGRRIETPLRSATEFDQYLEREFGIVTPYPTGQAKLSI